MRMTAGFIATIGVLAVPVLGQAAPVEVLYDDVREDSTENFEAFSPTRTDLGSPFDFGDFTFSGPSANVWVDSPSTCGAFPDACLFSRVDVLSTRTFSEFVEGATFFGFDLYSSANDDAYRVTVENLDGQSIDFQIAGNGQYAFGDMNGLASLSIVTLGGGPVFDNYVLDDIRIQVDDLTPVPLPATLWLTLAAMGTLVSRRDRTRALALTR